MQRHLPGKIWLNCIHVGGSESLDPSVSRLGLQAVDPGERRPGTIPETFEGENIAWGYDSVQGDVYPVPS